MFTEHCSVLYICKVYRFSTFRSTIYILFLNKNKIRIKSGVRSSPIYCWSFLLILFAFLFTIGLLQFEFGLVTFNIKIYSIYYMILLWCNILSRSITWVNTQLEHFFTFFFDVELCSLNIVQAIERYFKSKFLFYSGQNRLRLKK